MKTKEAWTYIANLYERRWIKGEEWSINGLSIDELEVTENGLCWAVECLACYYMIDEDQHRAMKDRIIKDTGSEYAYFVNPITGHDDMYYDNKQLRIDKARQYASELE